MRKGLIIGILLSGILVSCGSGSKEIVIDSNVKDGKKTKIIVEHIDNKENIWGSLTHYENGEPIMSGIIPEEATKTIENDEEWDPFFKNWLENKLYKITEDNKIEEVKNDRFMERSIWTRAEGAGYELDSSEKHVVGLTYYNEIENTRKVVKTFNKPMEVNNGNTPFPRCEIVKGNSDYIFYGITESSTVSSNEDVGANKFLEAGVVEISTGKTLKLDERFTSSRIRVFYNDGFYVVDKDFTLYKMEEKNGELIRGEKVNISKEFNIPKYKYTNPSQVKVEKDWLYILGYMWDGEGTSEYIYLGYNLKTGEKKVFDAKLLNNYNSFMFSLEDEIVLLHDEDKSQIGRIDKDGVKMIGELPIIPENFGAADIVGCIANENKDEFIFSYHSEEGVDSKFGYTKVKIIEE